MGAATHLGQLGGLHGQVCCATGMKAADSSPALYWKICLINGAVFVAATALLVVSPATVSYRVTASELIVLAAGLAVILATTALLLRSSLARWTGSSNW